jgi:hypothetical protein
MTRCAARCTEQVHAALWHRVRASVVRVGHVLVHGQRVGQTHGQRSVSDTRNVESVSSDQRVDESVDRQDTMISRTKQGTTKAVGRGMTKVGTGKAPTLRPRSTGKAGVRSEGARTPPSAGGEDSPAGGGAVVGGAARGGDHP